MLQWLDKKEVPEAERLTLTGVTLQDIYQELIEFPEFRSAHATGSPIDFSTFKRKFWRNQSIAKLANKQRVTIIDG